MILECLYLKDGVDPEYASRVLRQKVVEARNLKSGVPGTNISAGLRLRDLYIDWVESTEQLLSSFALDTEAPSMVNSARYWRIRDMDERTARPWSLIESEIKVQSEALDRLAADLDARAQRARTAPGDLAVLDTNALLEYLPPDQIPWTEVCARSPIRLVVPVRVIEELDAKKYVARSDLADRARRLLSQLEKVLGPGGCPAELREGVTIEVPLDAGRRLQTRHADEEILEACRELRLLTGRTILLVTADTAMRLRAQAREIPAVRIPAKYEPMRAPATPGDYPP